MNRIYNFNEHFFSNLDAPEKAYVLGVLFSDGCIYRSNEKEMYSIIISQAEDRKDIIEKISSLLNSNYPIHSKKTTGQTQYELRIKSNIMGEDLINLGCTPNKSLTLKFPNYIPANLMPHFIRGYFDGDGCIWNGKRKKMIVKDSSRKSGFRERIIHNVKFTFTGNVDFISSLQDYLVNMGIVHKKTKLNFSKAKNPSNNTCDKVCTMEYSGRKQIKNLYDYMYKDATVFCESKRLKFEEIFCASDEKSSAETVLTEETAEMPIVNQASNIEEGSSTIPEMGVESSDSKCTAPNE